jgi:hypothetical protein
LNDSTPAGRMDSPWFNSLYGSPMSDTASTVLRGRMLDSRTGSVCLLGANQVLVGAGPPLSLDAA